MSSCTDTAKTGLSDQISLRLPSDFSEVIYPNDNLYSAERWQLGKMLFYDTRLSIDSSISCGSCHKASSAFSDNIRFSLGVYDRIGTRNSPTLANVAFHPYFTREGGVPSLEQQILVPIQEHNEFDFNVVLAGERLAHDSLYTIMSQKAYNRDMDYFVITRAISTFERSLISDQSPFDAYRHNSETSPLTKSQESGMNLFFSEKTNCFTCHSGPNFTNYSFQNNGLYEVYQDNGKMRLTGNESDNALFKVPSLRNIEVSGPFMHDGSLNTLELVIEHYDRGGYSHVNKSPNLKPLNLASNEKEDLLNFLRSLTDEGFISNPKFKN
ncbi:cytochrome-c peroxidase [Bacteroidia bacterium]|nr:cytochrome-c peroxidase [Bacteroidia bacterium]MDB9881949.1 cytochrome-c peroxidase [Bacteroidia bacterium]